ncbi:MAG: methyltransferase domain-containing protein [Proteobacteria bacterium]|nr:methyltransferase domain-containing protein [Pseudomonadota bacterium]
MKSTEGIDLSSVKTVYNGPEGDLWELVMGEQIHIGGFVSSMALAEKAGIGEDTHGIDLCCCNGAGMRFLVRFRKVASMGGIDATETVVNRGKERCEKEGLSDKITFYLGDVLDNGLPDAGADFVWGEDAWCYVVDKVKLIKEAVRLVKPGGIIAFTDWVEGKAGLSPEEATRFFTFMKFPNIETIPGYKELLESNGCEVLTAEDTEQFPPYVDLYLDMLNKQLTYDALKIIGFDMELMQTLGGEMQFMQGLAHESKIAQGRFVARRK